MNNQAVTVQSYSAAPVFQSFKLRGSTVDRALKHGRLDQIGMKTRDETC
jgi:hypothetical protein